MGGCCSDCQIFPDCDNAYQGVAPEERSKRQLYNTEPFSDSKGKVPDHKNIPVRRKSTVQETLQRYRNSDERKLSKWPVHEANEQLIELLQGKGVCIV